MIGWATQISDGKATWAEVQAELAAVTVMELESTPGKGDEQGMPQQKWICDLQRVADQLQAAIDEKRAAENDNNHTISTD